MTTTARTIDLSIAITSRPNGPPRPQFALDVLAAHIAHDHPSRVLPIAVTGFNRKTADVAMVMVPAVVNEVVLCGVVGLSRAFDLLSIAVDRPPCDERRVGTKDFPAEVKEP